MKRFAALAVFALLALAMPAAAQTKDIVDTAAAAGTFKTLAAALRAVLDEV